MEQNAALPPVQTGTEMPSETARMKASYNRAGLGLTALYGIMQHVASAVLIIGIVIVALITLLPELEEIRSFRDLAGIMDLLKNSGAMGWVIVIYVTGMILGMTGGILIMRLICRKKRSIEKRSLSAGSFLKIVLLAYGLWGIGIVLGNFPSFVGAEEESMLDQLLRDMKWEALPMYLYMIIGAPVFEELACRKVLLDRLHPYGEGFAAAASGLLFGILHGNSTQFFLAFLLGFLFAMVYLRTGKIIYTMLLHGIINLTATVPELTRLAGVNLDDIWMTYVIGSLSVIGFLVLLFKRNDPLLHPERTSVPDAAAAAWKNAGMILARVGGIVLIAGTDLAMMALSIAAAGGMLPLLRLIPLTLAVVLILLLPGWTRRYEQIKTEISGEDGEVSLG